MKYIKSIYIGLVGLLMTACTDELPTQNYGEGEGRLVLSEVEVEAVVGDVITRASSRQTFCQKFLILQSRL